MRKLKLGNLLTLFISFSLVVVTMTLHLNAKEASSKAEEIRSMTWEELAEAEAEKPKDLLDVIVEDLVEELKSPNSAFSIGGKLYDMDVEELKSAIQAVSDVYNASTSHQYKSEVRFFFKDGLYNIMLNIVNPTSNVVKFIGQRVWVSEGATYWLTSAMDEGGVTVKETKEFSVNGIAYLDGNGQKRGGYYIPASELGDQKIPLDDQPWDMKVVVHICDGTDHGWISPEDINMETLRVIDVKKIEVE